MKLEVRDLSKHFQGIEALQNISFSVCSGKAFGLLGRNGAGKTTTLRILMDIFKADSGEILLDGKPFNPKDYKIGYLPEERGLYPKKKVGEQLMYLAQLRGLNKIEAKRSMDKWLKRLELQKHQNCKLENLSKGNQQKVQLIQTLICDPDIIILDEPFSGLDPVNSQVLQDLVKELVRDEKLVIFSSHQMNYVEDLCEEIAILKDGHIVLNGQLEDIKQSFSANRIVLRASNYNLSKLETLCFENLNHLVTVYDCKKKGVILQLLKGKHRNELLETLIKYNVEIERFDVYKPSLTDIFVLKAGD